MKKYRWGIIGTAKIARSAMIPALKDSAMAEVVAVASRDSSRARNFADELGIAQAYGSYQTMLDEAEIDAVYIPLPNHLHKVWTIRAAEAGKHILCEKPLALNPDECREMIAAAKKNGIVLMESFMYRYHPRIKAAREMVQSGAIGSVKTIQSALTFYLENQQDFRLFPEMGGGALMDVGCYCINISRLIAEKEPVTVHARAVWTKTGVDEQLVAILDFGDGLIAHFDCAFNMEQRQHCVISGTKGYLSLPRPFNPGKAETQLFEEKGLGNSKVHIFAGVNDYRLIAEDFMQSISSGVPAFPIEDSVANMQVMQALVTSAKNNGNPVDLYTAAYNTH